MSRLVLNKSGQWIKSIPKLSHKSNFKIPINTEKIKTTTTIPTTTSLDPPSPSPSTSTPSPPEPIPTPTVPIIQPIPIETKEPPPSPTFKIPVLPPVKSIRGIQIPIKPPPPGSEECCMSGCAHCVYDVYLSTLQEHQHRIGYTRTALMALRNPKIDEKQWPIEELGKMILSEGYENESPEVRAKKDLDLVMKDVDPSIRAFLEMEARLKKKKLDREKAEMDAMDALKKI